MKRRARLSVTALALLGASIAWIPPATAQAARAERPALTIGDAWTYQVSERGGAAQAPYTEGVRGASGDEILLWDGTSQSRYTPDGNFLRSERNSEVTVSADAVQAFYQFPLEVGKQWSTRFSIKHAGRDPERWSVRVTVEGYERVTVRAGTFDAFRMKLEGTFSYPAPNWGGVTVRYTETRWYAPAVKRHVRRLHEYYSSTVGGGNYERWSEELLAYAAPPASGAVSELLAQGAALLSTQELKQLLPGATLIYTNFQFRTELKLDSSGGLTGSSRPRAGIDPPRPFEGTWRVANNDRWCGTHAPEGVTTTKYCRIVLRLGEKYYYAAGGGAETRLAFEMTVAK